MTHDDLAPAELELELSRTDGHAVLRVRGEVDLYTAPRLADAVAEGLSAAAALTLDLTEVDFIESSGLRVLLEARRGTDPEALELRLRAGGPVERLLGLAGVQGLFRCTAVEDGP